MEHSHNHSHELPSLKDINKAFYIGIGLNLVFTLLEFIVGYTTSSLALVADASHNLNDVASLVISLIGMKLAQKATTKLYTYGYKKASIMASLINAILLIIIVLGIAKEAIQRFYFSPELSGVVIIVTALIGVIINTVSAFMFYKGQKDDINVKGAFLHLLLDALLSIGVVVSGIIIHYTHWNIVDPVISLIIAAIILASTWGLLKESIKLTLDGVPHNIDISAINNVLMKNTRIQESHHLHVWALSSIENALTVHIILKDGVQLKDALAIKKEIKEELKHYNVHHITIEIETNSERCQDVAC